MPPGKFTVTDRINKRNTVCSILYPIRAACVPGSLNIWTNKKINGFKRKGDSTIFGVCDKSFSVENGYFLSHFGITQVLMYAPNSIDVTILP